MILLTLPLALVLTTYALWVFYLAVMNIKRVRDEGNLSRLAKALATPVLIVGYLLDVIVNVFVFSIILLELPKETTVTARLKRHNAESSNWRKSVTTWFEPLLNPFDPSGDHI